MRSEISEDNNSPNTHEKKNRIVPLIRACLTALLLMNPSTQLKTEANTSSPQQEVAGTDYQEDTSYTEDTESVESVTSYEIIFKDGIRKALKDLNTINQIPV